MGEPSGRECQVGEHLASSNPRERALPPPLLTLPWLADRVPFTAPPATSWEARGRPEGKAGGAPAIPPLTFVLVFSVSSGEGSTLTPLLPSAPKIAWREGLNLAARTGVGHKFHS